MHIILKVKPLPDFQLELTFNDNKTMLVDLKKRLKGGIFEDLKDPEFFKKVFVDEEMGTIAWPNGADLCPDVLYLEGQEVPKPKRKMAKRIIAKPKARKKSSKVT